MQRSFKYINRLYLYLQKNKKIVFYLYKLYRIEGGFTLKLELTTPAVLFTSISLLISAYTSRFLTLAQLVRQLDSQYRNEPHEELLKQIKNIQLRINIIRYTQIMGGLSFFLCALSTFLIFRGENLMGEFAFGASLVALMISLLLLIIEVQISVKALNVQLEKYKINESDLK